MMEDNSQIIRKSTIQVLDINLKTIPYLVVKTQDKSSIVR